MIPEDVKKMAADRADWLVDAAATASQNRILLRGDPECDAVLAEAVLLNAQKAIEVAIMADRASRLPRQDDEIRRAALEEADGWQPIETAPMSFTPALGLINGSASVIAKSKDNRWCEVRHLASYDGVGARFPLSDNAQPSHWMPFPVRSASRALSQKGDEADG